MKGWFVICFLSWLVYCWSFGFFFFLFWAYNDSVLFQDPEASKGVEGVACVQRSEENHRWLRWELPAALHDGQQGSSTPIQPDTYLCCLTCSPEVIQHIHHSLRFPNGSGHAAPTLDSPQWTDRSQLPGGVGEFRPQKHHGGSSAEIQRGYRGIMKNRWWCSHNLIPFYSYLIQIYKSLFTFGACFNVLHQLIWSYLADFILTSWDPSFSGLAFFLTVCSLCF